MSLVAILALSVFVVVFASEKGPATIVPESVTSLSAMEERYQQALRSDKTRVKESQKAATAGSAASLHREIDNSGNSDRFSPTPYEHWPSYAKDCMKKYSGYACKPPEDGGGCIGCESGYLYGANIRCTAEFEGDGCDYGPHKCGKSVCFDKRLEADIQRDKSLILDALHMSSLSYTTPHDAEGREERCPGIAARMPKVNYERYDDYETQLTWGVAHHSYGQHRREQLYTVAFRGTSFHDTDTFMTNWLTNLKLYGVDLDGTVVHGGFVDALNVHLKALMKKMAKVSQMHSRVLVTGHSLGAGLANLFAYYIKKAHPHLKVELITAGGPRVGDAHFATRLEGMMSLIYRVNAWCDPIPRTPDSLYKNYGLLGLLHAGPQITVGADYSCLGDHPVSTLEGTNHDIQLYIQRVGREIPGPDESLCPVAAWEHAQVSTNSSDHDLFGFETAYVPVSP